MEANFDADGNGVLNDDEILAVDTIRCDGLGIYALDKIGEFLISVLYGKPDSGIGFEQEHEFELFGLQQQLLGELGCEWFCCLGILGLQ